MNIARWLVAIVAIYNFGGLIFDALIPFTAKMHIYNPAWKPHAKFHNTQSMIMGVMFGTLTLAILFAVPLTTTTFLIAVATSGIYFWAMLVGQFFPGGVAWTDPEFESQVKRVAGLPPQKFVALMLTGLLAVAVLLVFAL